MVQNRSHVLRTGRGSMEENDDGDGVSRLSVAMSV